MQASDDTDDLNSSSGDSGTAAIDEVNKQLRAAIRNAREERGWNQSQLGEAIGTSRFVVTRLERGQVELRADMAKRIEDALGVSGLLELVNRREQLIQSQDWSVPWTREAVMAQLLAKQGLRELQIVLSDDYDLATALENNPGALAAQIAVIVPTVGRERSLYWGDQPAYGHIQSQIKRLSDLGSQTGVTIDLFESERVQDPVAVAHASSGTEIAFWPLRYAGQPFRYGERTVPAGASLDGRSIAETVSHVTKVKEASSPIRKNDAVVTLEGAEERQIRFTRFVPHKDREHEIGEGEGCAVTLVLVHGLCPRRGHSVDHRAILYHRSSEPFDGGRLSLVSTLLDELDIRRGQADERPFGDDQLRRSSSDALTATIDVGTTLRPQDGLIPPAAFSEAAKREVFANLGIEVSRDRFIPIPLPSELERIEKSGGPRFLIPRLFHLELLTRDANDEPELGRVEKQADVEILGYEDILEREDLNDFLASAAKSGFLESTLRELGIARL